MEPSTPSEQPSALGVLRAAALALFAIFLVSVLLRAWPPRLLDPLWQISLATALLDMGGYALLGVVVLTIARLLTPEDAQLARLLRPITRLCGVAGLGYLLLVPLVLTALLRDYQQAQNLSQRQIREVNRMEQRLRQAIVASGSREELLRSVQRVNVPALGSFLLQERQLDDQRARALELLRDTASSARRQAGSSLGPTSLQAVLFNNLRLLSLSLVFAFGFASAHAGRLAFPLLEPLRRGLQRLRWQLNPERRSRSIAASEQAYFDALAQDEPPGPPP